MARGDLFDLVFDPSDLKEHLDSKRPNVLDVRSADVRRLGGAVETACPAEAFPPPSRSGGSCVACRRANEVTGRGFGALECPKDWSIWYFKAHGKVVSTGSDLDEHFGI